MPAKQPVLFTTDFKCGLSINKPIACKLSKMDYPTFNLDSAIIIYTKKLLTE